MSQCAGAGCVVALTAGVWSTARPSLSWGHIHWGLAVNRWQYDPVKAPVWTSSAPLCDVQGVAVRYLFCCSAVLCCAVLCCDIRRDCAEMCFGDEGKCAGCIESNRP
jgi:hypothetical protein